MNQFIVQFLMRPSREPQFFQEQLLLSVAEAVVDKYRNNNNYYDQHGCILEVGKGSNFRLS